VSSKSQKVSHLIPTQAVEGLDPHYVGYFDCFNRGLFFEAHEVLEQLWLKDRQGPNGAFYKGLIQLAGAFVHLRKERLRPAVALFKLAEGNLARYPADHERLHTPGALSLIRHWLAHLERSNFSANPLQSEGRPILRLETVKN
jgi:predicted metal-dependent hydrolase